MNEPGITPPLILSTNSKPSSPRIAERLDLDVAVAELAAPAGLLLVPPVRRRRAADRLLVGHARRLQRDLDAEAVAQAVDDHLDVHLREPGDDLLAGLLIAVQVDRRILLLQAAQRGEHLLLVPPALRLDRERHHRRRQLQARHLDRLVAVGQPVAGARLLELGDGADVARAELAARGATSLPANTSSWPMRSLTCACVFSTWLSARSTPW